MSAHQHAENIPVNIVFDRPPGPESCRFVEVETDQGKSIKLGEWIERPDGLWALRITKLPLKPQTITVNGVEVPKPLTELPHTGIVFTPFFRTKSLCIAVDGSFAEDALAQGIAHPTKEAARAHAEAMLRREE